MSLALIVETLIIAFVLALGFGRLAMALAMRMRWVDRPGHRKIHQRPVPYLGGLALFVALSSTLLLLRLFFDLQGLSGLSAQSLLVCIWPALVACLLGLWDDLFDLRARYKFAGQAALALGFSVFAYRFGALQIPGFAPLVLEPQFAVLVTAFFIVAVVNGFNMMDGSDALCLGASAVSLGLVALVAYAQGQPHFVLLGFAGFSACLGLMFWNRPPARIYLGDAGSQGLGFLVACLVLAVGKGEPGAFQGPSSAGAAFPPRYEWMVAALMVGWPALEVMLTVARRVLQGRGLGLADQGHIHHRLARLGLRPWGIVSAAVVVNVLSGATVLAFLAGHKGLAVLLVLPLAAGLSVGMQRLGYTRFFRRDWLGDRRPHFAVASHFAAMQAAKLKLARSNDEVLALVEQTCREFGVHVCRIVFRDADNKRWAWAWADSTPAHRVAWDRVRIAGTRNRGSWSADIHDDREPELSMNMRVVMVEFMRQSLERLGELARGVAAPAQDAAAGPKQHPGLAMSVKGLKQRL